jgi:hypothetical protein
MRVPVAFLIDVLLRLHPVLGDTHLPANSATLRQPHPVLTTLSYSTASEARYVGLRCVLAAAKVVPERLVRPEHAHASSRR